MVEQRRFIHGAGVVVKTAGDGEVNGKVILGHAEAAEILCDRGQLAETFVKHFVFAAVLLQCSKDLGIGAANGNELKHFVGVRLADGIIIDKNRTNHVRTDLFDLIHGAHDVARLLGKTEDGVEAVEDFAVVDTDLETLESQTGEERIDDGGDLRVVRDVKRLIADYVNIRLIELAEAAALGALTAVDLADLKAAEGERQLGIV